MRFKENVNALAVLALTVVATACATTGIEAPTDSIPLWARQFPRTVDHGYIIFMESDDDPVLETAKFKAESSALADLINECSMPPRGVRVEDHYEHKVGHLYQAYAKVAIEAQLCDAARKATTPEAIRKLGNPTISAEVKRFQDQAGETPAVVEGADSSGPSSTSPMGNVTVRDDDHYYLVREQLALAKQNLILAPQAGDSGAEAAGLAAADDARIEARTAAIQKYAAAHPQLGDVNRSWAYYRHDLLRPKINTNGQEVRQVSTKPSPTPGPLLEQKRHRKNLELDPTQIH